MNLKQHALRGGLSSTKV